MMSIIEDTLTKQRKQQERYIKQAERLKNLGAPQILIDHALECSKMTWAEHLLHEKEIEEQEKQHYSEYAKNNPLQEFIVNRIYEKAETIVPNETIYISFTAFLMELHPLEFMPERDFDNKLYESFLRHAHEIVRKKYIPNEKDNH